MRNRHKYLRNFRTQSLTMKMPLLLLSFLFIVNTSYSQSKDWIIKTSEKIDLEAISKNYSTEKLTSLCLSLNIYRFQTDEIISESDLQTKYLKDIKLINISQNMDVELRMTPNDFYYGDQWHLRNTKVDLVWQETTGRSPSTDFEPVIVLMDDGFDTMHEDLEENVWTNNQEIPNDGIDNDNNGFIDDYRGLNIETYNDQHAVNQHGTQVAGILGAKGNNEIGIAGVTWESKMIIISNVTNVAEIISGLDYSYNLKKLYLDTDGAKGANVVVNNFSGGIKYEFPDRHPEWCEMYDLLGTVGILSVGAVANIGFNVEVEGDMPTLCTSPYFIAVTNSNQNDEKVFDAAYGSVSVDLGAPGEGIISTDVDDRYTNISGTSASSPQVAGAIALLYTIACDNIKTLSLMNPSQFALELKGALLNGVDKNSSFDETVSNGKLNLFESMLNLTEICGEIKRGELNIYAPVPNPVRGNDISNLEISYITDISSEHEIIMYDRIGRIIYSRKFTPSLFSEKVITLEGISNVDAGVYFITILNETNKDSVKLTVVE